VYILFTIMLNVIDINVIHSSCEGLLIHNDFVSFICIYLYSLVFKSMGSVRQFYWSKTMHWSKVTVSRRYFMIQLPIIQKHDSHSHESVFHFHFILHLSPIRQGHKRFSSKAFFNVLTKRSEKKRLFHVSADHGFV